MLKKDRGKIDSCLSSLKGVILILRGVIDYGLEQLRVSAVKPRVTPWVDAFLSIDHHINEVCIINRNKSHLLVPKFLMDCCVYAGRIIEI